MTKPSSLPAWGTTAASEDVVEPSTPKKNSGWTKILGIPEKPAYQYFNWWMKLVSEWIDHLSETGVVQVDSTTIDVSEGNVFVIRATDHTEYTFSNLEAGKRFCLIIHSDDTESYRVKFTNLSGLQQTIAGHDRLRIVSCTCASSTLAVIDSSEQEKKLTFGSPAVSFIGSIANTSLSTDRSISCIVADDDGLIIAGDNLIDRPKAPFVSVLDAATGKYNEAFSQAVDGFNGDVYAISCYGDFIYFVGNFTTWRGRTANYIIKFLRSTMAPDPDWNSGTGLSAIATSCKATEFGVYVGGNFTSYNGTTRTRLALIDHTGAIDTNFDTATGADNYVDALCYTTLGLYIGGLFLNYKGSGRQRVALVNARTGALDGTFNTATAFNGAVQSLLFDTMSAGLFCAGAFTQYNVTTCTRLARLNSTTGALVSANTLTSGTSKVRIGWGPVTEYNDEVNANRSIVMVGDFVSSQGMVRKGIAMYDTQTLGLVSAFNDTTSGFPSATYANYTAEIVSFNEHCWPNINPGLCIFGMFNELHVLGSNVSCRGSAKILLGSNVIDTSFARNGAFPNYTKNTSPDYSARCAETDGEFIYLGHSIPRADFSQVSDFYRDIIKVRWDGTIDKTFSCRTNNEVHTMILDGENLYIGGSFTSIWNPKLQMVHSSNNPTTHTSTQTEARTINRLAKLSSKTGIVDYTFNAGNAGPNSDVWGITITGTDLYFCGNFTTYNGTNRQRVAKCNANSGAIDVSFNSASGFDAVAYSLALDGNNLFVGGDFTTYGATGRLRIAKMDKDTAVIDGTFDAATGFDVAVYKILVNGSYVYCAGNFDNYKANQQGKVCRVNSSTAAIDLTWCPAGDGFDAAVYDMAISGSDIYFFGNFTKFDIGAGAKQSDNVAKAVLATLTFPAAFEGKGTTFPTSTPKVFCGAVANSEVFFGGDFWTYDGMESAFLCAVDTTNGDLVLNY